MQIKNLTKKEKYILIIIISLIGLLLIYFFSSYKKESVNSKIDNVSLGQTQLPPKFSRITFFHTAKPICTLAIPETWEGKYRLQDNGGVAHFLYIQEAGNPELFYIKKYKKDDKINESTERLLLENNNGRYAVSLSTMNVNKTVNKEDYLKMTKDLDDVLKNFRCF